MEKESKEKETKKRAKKYDGKLAINGTFEQVIQASFLGKPPLQKDKK